LTFRLGALQLLKASSYLFEDLRDPCSASQLVGDAVQAPSAITLSLSLSRSPNLSLDPKK
jgi:hypothetical protein